MNCPYCITDCQTPIILEVVAHANKARASGLHNYELKCNLDLVVEQSCV